MSTKFINAFEGVGEVVMHLDNTTTLLNVERRRIYDVVNIFESLKVITK